MGGDDGTIHELDLSTGRTSVLAQGLGLIRGIVPLEDGTMLVTALLTHVILIVGADGTSSILAGASGQAGTADGAGTFARFNQPVDIVRLPDGSFAVSDLGNDRIRRVTPSGSVTTLAGSSRGFRDGATESALFAGPSGLAVDGLGNLYVSDRFNHRIRKITPDGLTVTVAGDGNDGFLDSPDPLRAEFAEMEGIDLAPSGDALYIADGAAGSTRPFHRLRVLVLSP